MVKRIDDLGNVKGSKPAKQNDRVQRAESSAREPKSSKSAVVLTKATEKLFPSLSPNAREFLVDTAIGLKKRPKGIAKG